MTRLANVSVGGTITAADTNATRAMVNKTMQLMTPTSVSAGSIGTYGAVTFSAAASVSINGCFTSEFDTYLVKYYLTTSASSNALLTLRLAGTDATTAYDRQYQRALNATNTVAQSLNQANWPLALTNVQGFHYGSVELFNPAQATATVGVMVGGTTANPMTTADGAAYNAAFLHRTATAYDGITLAAGSGNLTGWCRVYGII